MSALTLGSRYIYYTSSAPSSLLVGLVGYSSIVSAFLLKDVGDFFLDDPPIDNSLRNPGDVLDV